MRGRAHILLVEDSPTDAMIVGEILAQQPAPPALHVVEDGLQAMAFLKRDPPYADAPRPDLILLDWKLPRKGGHEVLAEIKADPRLSATPLVVLTSSRDHADVLRAYRLHANAYVPKPVDYADFADALRLIERFWLDLAALPEDE